MSGSNFFPLSKKINKANFFSIPKRQGHYFAEITVFIFLSRWAASQLHWLPFRLVSHPIFVICDNIVKKLLTFFTNNIAKKLFNFLTIVLEKFSFTCDPIVLIRELFWDSLHAQYSKTLYFCIKFMNERSWDLRKRCIYLVQTQSTVITNHFLDILPQLITHCWWFSTSLLIMNTRPTSF